MTCLYALPQGCCGGPWDFYYDASGASAMGAGIAPETPETPNIPRTASIYLDNEAGEILDWDSYDDWFVAIADSGAGANFQEKVLQTSIAPLGQTLSELVYFYMEDHAEHEDDSGLGMAQVDAESREVDWIVTDQDWIDATWPAMQEVTITGTYLNTPWSPQTWDSEPTNIFDDYVIDVGCPHAAGIMRWSFTAAAGADAFRWWTIDAAGDFDYLTDDPFQNYADANPGEILQTYTYLAAEGNPWDPESGDLTLSTNDLYLPVGQAPQSDVVIGIRYPHATAATFPEDREDFPGGTEFTAVVRVAVGSLTTDPEYGYPGVSGEMIWEMEKEYRSLGAADSITGSLVFHIETMVNQFDALRTDETTAPSIAIITYKFLEDFEDDATFDWVATTIESRTVLVVNGNAVPNTSGERIFRYTGHVGVYPGGGSGTYSADAGDDLRDYYPRWANPRVLQPTEEDQGGGQRFIAFARTPFDEDEADDYPSSDLFQWRLTCYLDDGTELYNKLSRYGRSTHPVGTVQMFANAGTGSPLATFDIFAIEGGDADEAATNGIITIEVEQTIGDAPEDAVWDRGTQTLTVKLDIAGGNDQMSDLRAVIDAAGDFYTDTSTSEAAAITANAHGDTDDSVMGSGAVLMALGTDTPDGSIDTPMVHDSSDRWCYVVQFPYRVRVVVNNRWHALLVPGATPTYPTAWMISHDGELMNPCGSGTDRTARQPVDFFQQPASGLLFSSIKNSELLPLAPELEEI